MSQTRTGHKPEDWRDEGPSVVIRHGNGIEAEPVGRMRPILTNRVVLENRSRVKVPQAFSIHLRNRTPTVMTPVMTNLDNGAVKAPITEVQS